MQNRAIRGMLSRVAGLAIGAAIAAAAGAMTSHAATANHARSNRDTLTADAIENAQWSPQRPAGKLDPVVFKAQVLLDRAGFSPGEIDARGGENFDKAIRAYQQANELEPTGKLDQPTWAALAHASTESAVRSYTIAAADLKGPFVKKIPRQFSAMARLDWLGYRSPRELLAEKFHMSEAALAALNRGETFDHAGAIIAVANVEEMTLPHARAKRRLASRATAASGVKAARVEVDKTARVVRVFGPDGALVAFYPASIGSKEKPAPSGKFVVRNVVFDPTYRYDPKYAFKGQHAEVPVTVRPGPRNPVGLVWIDLSAKSYGIHGTPQPENVSKTQSHGCIRLTNWDALALASLVDKGTPVEFIE